MPLPDWPANTGVFAEPAGAAAYAGLLKAVEQKQVAKDETVVVLNTGNGLKDVAGAMPGGRSCGNQAVSGHAGFGCA